MFPFQYKNREYFAQFVTEDIDSYVSRKRNNHVHGNHIEIQAISEIYNRPVELYLYDTGNEVILWIGIFTHLSFFYFSWIQSRQTFSDRINWKMESNHCVSHINVDLITMRF